MKRRPAAWGGAAAALLALGSAAVLSGLAGQVLEARAVPTPAPAVVRRAGFAMGSFVQVVAAGPGAEAAADAALAEVQRLERLLDRFDPGSPVSAVNRLAGRGDVPVPPEVGEVVSLALEVARRTGGAFDPTVAPLVDLWGFGAASPRAARPSRPPPDEAVEAARRRVGWEGVRVVRGGGAVRVGLAREGMALDLGGIAQGYAADRAIAVLRAHGVSQGLVDVGGEVAVLGTRPAAPGEPAGQRWRVGIQHPRDPQRLVATVLLSDGAVATSGDYERYFEYQGRRFCHLIDPRTGRPATGLVSASVLHPSAAVADALATAVMVLGPRDGAALIRAWPGARAILVDGSLRVMGVTGP